MTAQDAEAARRWRLVLGRYADDRLPAGGFGGADARIERTLGYLYDREYAARGHRHAPGQGGSLDPSALTAVSWLAGARELFPQATFERIQVQALEQYGLTELLADEATVDAMPPSVDLATALLAVRGKLDGQVEEGMRRIIAAVVDDIVRRIRPRFATAFSGRRDRNRRSAQRIRQNFDWQRTVRANLGNYDTENQRLVINEPRFHSTVRRTVPWDVIICVDQSGSMAASLLYSAVCAGIMSSLPGVTVRLVLFDTSVVDLSHIADDPVGVLMTAQLGGGTDIAKALAYCETLVTTPKRTVLALISDFEEGGSVSRLLSTVGRLSASGVTMLGMAALDERGEAVYDPHVAGRLAARGMEVAAATPEHFAEWVGEVMA